MSLPSRLYVCGFCGYHTERRWLLRDHLYNRHALKKGDAYDEAYRSEYHLTTNPAPRYVAITEDEDEEYDEDE